MANVCENKLIVRGAPERLQAFRAAVAGTDVEGEPLPFSLERIVATPEAYRDGTSLWEDSVEFDRLAERYMEICDDEDERRSFIDDNPGFALTIIERG